MMAVRKHYDGIVAFSQTGPNIVRAIRQTLPIPTH
jgi:hypothetical protein